MHPKDKLSIQELYIQNLLFFFIFLNFFFPKISLLNIPGFTQGIRLENVICFFLLLALIVCQRVSLTLNDFDNLKPYIIFFMIFIFSSYVGWISGIDIQFIFLLRIIEYLVFAFVIFKSQIKIQNILIFVKFFYLASLIGIFIQYLGLMGTFSSTGLSLNSEGKYTGFVSGSWELAFMISISYFLILSTNEKNNKQIIFYLFFTLLILYLAGNRTIVVSFLVSLITYFFLKSKTINSNVLIYFIMFFLLFLLFFLFNGYELQPLDQYVFYTIKNPNALVENVLNIEYNYVFQTIKEFLFFGNILDISDTPQQYTSLHYRLIHWDQARDNFLTNGFTIIFGSGAEFIYYDSIIFRIIFTTGLIGSLFIIILMIKIPLYIIFFFLLSGLTIDFLASYKLSVTIIILHFVIVSRKKYANRH